MANSWDPVAGTEEYLETLERALVYAKERGLSINRDGERVKKVIGLMTMNLNAAGDYYCPCKQSHPLDTDNDVLCPCPEIDSEIEAEGSCFCKLFFS